MKLYTRDDAELMDIRVLRTQGDSLIVEGTIMGAMPTEAVLKPAELRKLFKLLNVRTVWFVIGMMFRK